MHLYYTGGYPPRKVKTKCNEAPAPMPASCTELSSFNCDPLKMRRCCDGGIPSFSSIISLMRATRSVGSMSTGMSLPVNVLTLICMGSVVAAPPVFLAVCLFFYGGAAGGAVRAPQ